MSDQAISSPADVHFPWERMDKEPMLWFRRFQLYLWAGWKRSLYGACVAVWEMGNVERRAQNQEETKKPSGTPGSWRKVAMVWQWESRAEAWDKWRAEAVEKNVKAAWEELSFLLFPAVKTLAEIMSNADEEQKRLAATSILQRAFTLWGGGEPGDKPKEIQFVEFV